MMPMIARRRGRAHCTFLHSRLPDQSLAPCTFARLRPHPPGSSSRRGSTIVLDGPTPGVTAIANAATGGRMSRHVRLGPALTADAIPWLLEGGDPSVRFFALTDLLGVSPDGPEAAAARGEIMTTGAVPAILAAQDDDGHWEGRDRFYAAKYKGTVWQLIILAELGAQGSDERVRRGCEAILRDAQDRESGGFSLDRSKKSGGGLPSRVVPCLTGNLVWSLIRLGMIDDARVQRGIEWLTTYARFDDGEGEAPTGWPYDAREMCWGRHTCHMGAVKTLKALAEIPAGRRSAGVQRTLEQGSEFILRHHVHKRSHDLKRVSKPGWKRFSFPLMYQTDVLEILGILSRLGCRDERAREALELVAAKQDAEGRWKLEDSFNGRFVVDIEVKAQPSRWITLRALRLLKDAPPHDRRTAGLSL
jgi:hypothetical protein